MPDLISFDIDGTLVTGNGPGPITLEMVRRAVEHGHIIGSASDRPVQDQKNMWAAAGIEVSFTVLKHRLDTIKAQYTDASGNKIGDLVSEDLTLQLVPEPTTLLLVGSVLAGLGIWTRKRWLEGKAA